MRRYGKTSELSLLEVLQKAENFFGPKGLGLDILEHTVTGIAFAGGGGSITLSMALSTAGTEVDIISREWDYQAEQFLQLI